MDHSKLKLIYRAMSGTSWSNNGYRTRLAQVVNGFLSCPLVLIHHNKADPVGIKMLYIVSRVGRNSGINIVSVFREEVYEWRFAIVVAILYLGVGWQRQMLQVRDTLLRVLRKTENR
jgi:hypothetical protein